MLLSWTSSSVDNLRGWRWNGAKNTRYAFQIKADFGFFASFLCFLSLTSRFSSFSHGLQRHVSICILRVDRSRSSRSRPARSTWRCQHGRRSTECCGARRGRRCHDGFRCRWVRIRVGHRRTAEVDRSWASCAGSDGDWRNLRRTACGRRCRWSHADRSRCCCCGCWPLRCGWGRRRRSIVLVAASSRCCRSTISQRDACSRQAGLRLSTVRSRRRSRRRWCQSMLLHRWTRR